LLEIKALIIEDEVLTATFKTLLQGFARIEVAGIA